MERVGSPASARVGPGVTSGATAQDSRLVAAPSATAPNPRSGSRSYHLPSGNTSVNELGDVLAALELKARTLSPICTQVSAKEYSPIARPTAHQVPSPSSFHFIP
ncbi:hypothetical protein ACFX13_017430 [Malus domestica]